MSLLSPQTYRPLLLLLLLLCQGAHAESIEVAEAKVQLQEGLYLLDATIHYPLHDELLEALHSGISLPFKVIVVVYVPHNYWPDTEVAFLKQRYTLRYHALSRQYIVTNQNTTVSENFSSLAQALDQLGNIKALPVIDHALLEAGVNYHLRIRASINTALLSIPLRLTSYIYGPWKNSSEWWDTPL